MLTTGRVGVYLPPVRKITGVPTIVPAPENTNRNYIGVNYGCQSCKEAMASGDYLAPIKRHPIISVGVVLAIIIGALYLKKRF